jgi:DNA-binding beta-propeller fold protein YncE
LGDNRSVIARRRHAVCEPTASKEGVMRAKLLCAAAVALALTLLGCGLPEAQPSPHAATVVQPLNGEGKLYLFASNRFVDAVYRIDLETLKFKAVKVGDKPRNLAASPDGLQVAVANEGDHSISLIDSVHLDTRTVQTGRKPFDVRYSPDGLWLAVANYDDETVSLIDPATRELWDVWVGGGPSSVAFDDRSEFVAVACFHENAVKLIGVADKLAVASWLLDDIAGAPVDAHPQTVTFGPAGTAHQRTMFVGMRPDDYDTEAENGYDSYADSIAVIPFPPRFSEDPTATPDGVQIVRAGPNPRGFIFNHAGDRLLAINHVYDVFDEHNPNDTISELTYSAGDEEQASGWRDAAAKRPVAVGLAVRAYDWMADLTAHWFEQRRYAVDRNPVAGALAPDRDLVAVANKDSGTVSLLDLTDAGTVRVSVDDKPFALAFTPSGRWIVVVHETALMPVSVIDVQNGTSKKLYESLSMDRWLEH